MIQFRIRGPEVAIARLYQPEAEIHVVERDRQGCLVQPADIEECLPAHQQARSGDSRYVPNQFQVTEVTDVVSWLVQVWVSRDAAHADGDPAVLDRAVGIKQLGA